MEERFGATEHYLVDFWQVCDYLGAVAKAITPTQPAAKMWMAAQQGAPEDRPSPGGPRRPCPAQSAQIDDAQAPVRVCHRYVSQRLEQFHYHEALRQDLPIGPGEIASAYRYLVQQRLHHPEHLSALHLPQANGRWPVYWREPLRQPA